MINRAMTEGLRNFAARYNYAINDPELIRRYRMVEDGKRDVATRISVAEKRGERRGEKIGEKIGEERGKKIGERNAKLEDARRMKEEGIMVDVISRVTGIPVNEIADL